MAIFCGGHLFLGFKCKIDWLMHGSHNSKELFQVRQIPYFYRELWGWWAQANYTVGSINFNNSDSLLSSLISRLGWHAMTVQERDAESQNVAYCILTCRRPEGVIVTMINPVSRNFDRRLNYSGIKARFSSLVVPATLSEVKSWLGDLVNFFRSVYPFILCYHIVLTK